MALNFSLLAGENRGRGRVKCMSSLKFVGIIVSHLGFYTNYLCI